VIFQPVQHFKGIPAGQLDVQKDKLKTMVTGEGSNNKNHIFFHFFLILTPNYPIFYILFSKFI